MNSLSLEIQLLLFSTYPFSTLGPLSKILSSSDNIVNLCYSTWTSFMRMRGKLSEPFCAALSCVYTMQPAVQPAVQPVVQPAARVFTFFCFWIFIICVRPRYIIRLQPPFWHGETKCWWCSYFCRCSSSGYRNNYPVDVVDDEDYSIGVCCGVSRGCKHEIVAECQIMTLTFGRSRRFGQAHRT